MGGGQGGGNPEESGAGEVREVGEKKAGSGSSKMAGCGNEMQNATRCHLVCIRIPIEQEREMIFDLHQRLLSNQATKIRTWSETMDVSSLYKKYNSRRGNGNSMQRIRFVS